jgi:acyl-CoA thioesterase-1
LQFELCSLNLNFCSFASCDNEKQEPLTIPHFIKLGYPLACAMVAVSCEADAGPTSPSAPLAVSRLAVIGDSLAVSPTRDEGFPAVLRARLEALGLHWTVTNASGRGDTTADGLRRLDDVLADDPGILVLALGANDGLRGIDIATVTRNLSQIIERAQAQGVQVLLCGMETPPLRGWGYTRAFHEIFPGLAARYNIPMVPFLLDRVVGNPDLNGSDFIHPNAAGARQIADTIWPYLEPLVRRDVSPTLA